MAHVRDLLLSDSDTERQFDDVFRQYLDAEARAISSDNDSNSDTESDSGDDGIMGGRVAEAAAAAVATPRSRCDGQLTVCVHPAPASIHLMLNQST